jgi:epsin
MRTGLTLGQALQLLEFLVKNGSERVVDDARSHLSLIRMLRQFHYIDENGKDQGVNVRNRSGELVKLLSDVEAIRAERKKSRANKNKYNGVEGGAGLGMGLPSGTGGRYGGFGSESAGYGGYQGEVYGDGGGFGGRETDFSGTQRRGEQFEEYDAEEEGATTSGPARTPTTASTTRKAPTKKPEPVPDLFDFGEDEPPAKKNGKAPSNAIGDFGPAHTSTAPPDEDDFDDFQSAASPAAAQPAIAQFGKLSPPPTTSTTTSATQFAAPQPVAPAQAANLNSLFSAGSITPSVGSPPPSSVGSPPPGQRNTPIQPAAQHKPSGPNYYASVNSSINTGSSVASAFSARPTLGSSNQSSFTSSTSAATLGKPITKPSATAGGDVFGNLWSNASTKAGVQNKAGGMKGPDLASMAKAKSEAGIWGAATSSATGASQPRPGAIPPSPSTAAGQGRPQASLGNGLDDLLG